MLLVLRSLTAVAAWAVVASPLPSALPAGAQEAIAPGNTDAAAAVANTYLDSILARAELLLTGKSRDPALAARLFEQAVSADSPHAMIALANLYRQGDGVAKDYAAAEDLLRRASDTGAAVPATVALAALYRTSDPPFRDSVKAVAAYEKAVAMGDTGAMISLAQMVGAGEGTAMDFNRAKDLLETAISRGDTLAAWPELARLYVSADEDHRDLAKAAHAYQQAAYFGDGWSMIALARMYGLGDGVPVNFDKARLLLDSAIAIGGNSLAAAWVGLGDLFSGTTASNRRAMDEAIKAYQAAIELGSTGAMITLARIYGAGDGVAADFQEAKRLLLAAIAAGDAKSGWYALGDLYRTADDENRNLKQAVAAYTKAIDHADTRAMIALARIYSASEDSEAGFASAKELLERAISEGNGLEGWPELANLYKNASGSRRDLAKAAEAYERAVELGDPWSMISLAGLLGHGVPMNFGKSVSLLERAAATRGDSENWAWAALGDLYRMAEPPDRNPEKAVSAYDKAVGLGNTGAMISLAQMYGSGVGVPVNFEMASKLLEKAIKGGNIHDGWYGLAALYRGAGPGKFAPAAAAAIYQKASELGDPWSMIALAGILASRNGVAIDYDRAISLLEAAIGAGPDSAKWAWSALGDIYRTGDSAHRDVQKAVLAYEKAIDLENTSAAIVLGRMYGLGDGVLVDFARATTLLTRAIANGSAVEGWPVLGDLYRHADTAHRDLTKAADAYEKAIELGDSWSMIKLAQMLGFGEGVAVDFDRSVELLETAAAKPGESAAWGWKGLGDLYRNSAAVARRDPKKAALAYQSASELGNSVAMVSLAQMLTMGDGITSDYTKAKSLLEKAIATGSPAEAGMALGDIYFSGVQGSPDPVSALRFYEVSAQAGNGRAHLAAARLRSPGFPVAETRAAVVDHFRQAAAILGVREVAKAMFGLTPESLYATVQEFLVKSGYYTGKADGIFGGRLQNAIDRYCAANQISGCGQSIVSVGLLTTLLKETARSSRQ